MEIYDAICIFLCFIGGTFPIPVLWYAVKWDSIRIFNGKGFPIPIDEMIYMIWFGVSVIIDSGLALQWIVEGRGTVPATCICVLAGLLTSICGSLLWMHTAEGRRNIMIIRARRMDKRLRRLAADQFSPLTKGQVQEYTELLRLVGDLKQRANQIVLDDVSERLMQCMKINIHGIRESSGKEIEK